MGSRLQIALDAEYRRIQNEWLFKWHHIGREETVEIDSFDGRMICYEGIAFAGTARDIYWQSIQRYLRQKVSSLVDEVEREVLKYPVDMRREALGDAFWLISQFAAKIRSSVVEKDRILRGNGIEFPLAQDLGSWEGTRTEYIQSRVDHLALIYCDLEIAQKDGYMLDHLLNDRVVLVKQDGTVLQKDIPALVTKGKIQIHDTTIPIEVGDRLLRRLPSELVEEYVVDDPVLQSGSGSIKPFYIVHVSRSGQSVVKSGAVIQNFNFHGANSRVNIDSIDNSANISGDISLERLRLFLGQVTPAVGGLPEPARSAIAEPLSLLEDEVRSGAPSQSKVTVALQSIKTVAEGAVGNLIAVGILGLIAAI